ncbi:nuclear transport factor 2 family protein [Dokdonella sp.]|uniref:nuclear transport factor 2 family protein n=1 Tax=Dokdonella sp. TaxID=2291710 RepID=UPI002C5D07FE|nr:nuclear transport factor 2 family protein [Dokdonella sp.]HOX71697.1 nuclear transport factor 2 family protein [Dokdonella sp.]HPN78742.1 nuclear transport factor 2 family protein [Dokdonella sp.]
MRSTRRFTCLVLALILPGIAIAAESAVADSAQRAGELLSADRAFAAASAAVRGIDGMVAAFTDDVVVPMPGKGLLAGKAAVIEALRANPGTADARIEWTPLRVGVSADASQGFSFGYMLERRADGTSVPYKYLSYWRCNEGTWKVLAWKRGRRGAGGTDATTMPPLLPGPGFDKGQAAGGAARDLEQAELAFSDEAQTIGLGPAFAKYGTRESMNLGGPAHAGLVFGADAIAALVGEGQPAGGSSVNWSATRVIVAGSGDLGVSIGLIRHNASTNEAAERPPLPFFTVWRRAAVDQPWRYVAE